MRAKVKTEVEEFAQSRLYGGVTEASERKWTEDVVVLPPRFPDVPWQ